MVGPSKESLPSSAQDGQSLSTFRTNVPLLFEAFWEGSGEDKKVFEVCGRGD
jgi:hypothetical protein